MENLTDSLKLMVRHIPFVPDVLAMYFCLIDVRTPLQAKAVVLGAIVRWRDPLVVQAALTTVHGYVREEHILRANSCLAPVAPLQLQATDSRDLGGWWTKSHVD